MEYDDRNSWGHGYGRDENFHTERNYCEEWPTPWEGRIDQWWDEKRRHGGGQ